MSIQREGLSGSEKIQQKESENMKGTELQVAAQLRKHRRRWGTLVVLSLSLIVIGLDITILNVAIPTFQRELSATAADLQWILNAYILVFAGLLLTMGALGDRIGRRRALEIGLVLFGVASLAAAYSQTTTQLIAARAFMGVGGAMIMPSTLSILVDVFPREERVKAIGIWSAVAAIGVPLGMVLGGWLLDNFWWGIVFVINTPVVIVALTAGRVLIPESRDPKPGRIDILGAVLSMGALSTLIYSLIEAPVRGWLDPLILSGFAVALIVGVVFVAYELRTSQPMLQMRYFRNPRLSAGAGAIGVAFMSMLAVMFILTQYLQFVRGYSPFDTGLRFVPMALGFMIGGPTSALLVARLGTRKLVTAGMLVLAIAIGGLALVDGGTPYWVIGLDLVALGMGMAYTMAPATDAVMAALPAANAGVGSALNDTTRQVGGALGIGIFGSLLNSLYSSNVANAVIGLPSEAAEAARNSVGAAAQIAATIAGPAGEALGAAARAAFVDTQGIVFIVSAATVFLGGLLVFRFMPAHDLVVGDVATQAAGESVEERQLGVTGPARAPDHIAD